MPRDIEAEQITLGAILVDSQHIFTVSEILSESDFFSEAHRIIYRALRSLKTEDIGIDLFTLKSELQRRGELEKVGGIIALTTLTEGIARATNVKHYCNIIRQRAMSRHLMQMAYQMHHLASTQEAGPLEIVERYQAKLIDIYTRYQSEGLKPIAEIASAGFRELEERKNSGSGYGLRTGFYDLDRYLGGLRPGDLIILAARPACGKTALAVNIASHVSGIGSGKRTAIFSMEMRDTQLYNRMLAAETGIPVGALLGGWFSKDRWPAITAGSSALSEKTIWIDHSSDLNIEKFWARCERQQKSVGLDLVIVDYLQLMDGPGKTIYEKTTNISRMFKRLAGKLGCPIIALSQLHRLESEDKEPQLSDLRESGAIEQDADVVIFLWRGSRDEIRKCKVAKQRNGPTGTFDIGFDAEQTRFFTCTQDRD